MNRCSISYRVWQLCGARLVGAIILYLLCSVSAALAERPNVLWISCEDIGPHLKCYGYEDAITPTLDALASRGVRYTNAFATTPVCATCRSSIITGIYPTTIGSHFMRCEIDLPVGVRCFTEYLREAGYYCTNNSKEDYNFEAPAAAWDDSSATAHWRGRDPGQPFFAVFNLTLSHESKIWPRGSAHRELSKDLVDGDLQDPAKLTPPPYYPDTPEVRRDWANYLENITQIDHQTAAILDQLREDRLADNTIVFFWSDHGAGLPRAKRWAYDSGTHVPLILRIPEGLREVAQCEPGTISHELVCSVDLAPTVLNLVGLEIPAVMQGRAFWGSNLSPPREYVVNVRDRMDDRYDIVRAVRDDRYRYIRNYMPWKPYAQYVSYAEVNQTMKALRKAVESNNLPKPARLFMSLRKPAEELYDIQEDPHEIDNLAASPDPTHRKVLAKMRARLAHWEVESGDLGLIPEPLLRDYERTVGNGPAVLQRPGMNESLNTVKQLLGANMTSAERLNLAREQLASREAVTRYWAILVGAHVDEIAGDSDQSDETRLGLQPQELQPLLLDSSATVQVTAAAAIYAISQDGHALDVLLAGLEDNSHWVRLLSANYLDELAPGEQRAILALESVHEDAPDAYAEWVAEHALHRIDGRELKNPWE